MSVKLICSFSFSVWAAAGRANLDFPSAGYCTAEEGGGGENQADSLKPPFTPNQVAAWYTLVHKQTGWRMMSRKSTSCEIECTILIDKLSVNTVDFIRTFLECFHQKRTHGWPQQNCYQILRFEKLLSFFLISNSLTTEENTVLEFTLYIQFQLT